MKSLVKKCRWSTKLHVPAWWTHMRMVCACLGIFQKVKSRLICWDSSRNREALVDLVFRKACRAWTAFFTCGTNLCHYVSIQYTPREFTEVFLTVSTGFRLVTVPLWISFVAKRVKATVLVRYLTSSCCQLIINFSQTHKQTFICQRLDAIKQKDGLFYLWPVQR